MKETFAVNEILLSMFRFAFEVRHISIIIPVVFVRVALTGHTKQFIVLMGCVS